MEKLNKQALIEEMTLLKNPGQAKILSGFFKTGKGQYGEGDLFLGIKVPVLRALVKKYAAIPLNDVLDLLHSAYHEHRLTALLILVRKFERASSEPERTTIYSAYLKNTKFINNWDLVDLSAPNIVGTYLLQRDRKVLYALARSKNLWERRISMLATFAFIRHNQVKDTCALADLLLNDTHDLIHKAVGWMLRELGKRVSEDALKKFLEQRYKTMPRTMLRYAIERLGEKDKRYFMS